MEALEKQKKDLESHYAKLMEDRYKQLEIENQKFESLVNAKLEREREASQREIERYRRESEQRLQKIENEFAEKEKSNKEFLKKLWWLLENEILAKEKGAARMQLESEIAEKEKEASQREIERYRRENEQRLQKIESEVAEKEKEYIQRMEIEKLVKEKESARAQVGKMLKAQEKERLRTERKLKEENELTKERIRYLEKRGGSFWERLFD